ncbi:MAG: RNA ligase RtcB family protein [Burkholderiaceae bacterium]
MTSSCRNSPSKTSTSRPCGFSGGLPYPALVGNDIGCGMALWQTDLKAASVSLDKLERRVGNIDGPMDEEASRAQAMAAHGVVAGAHDASLGTIGGGNHFAEFQQVDTVFDAGALSALGLDAKRLLLLVHTGSRGLGERILRQHVDAVGHAGQDAETSEAADYLARHGEALRWAHCNRQLVAQRLLGNVRGAGRCVLDVHHNFLAPALIDGQAGWLHRKGATPSDAGPVLIPGSRGDHSYLVRPLRLCHDTLLSLAHGAGRKWVRSACKDRLHKLMTPAQMGRTALGSRVICNDRQLIYEEAPQAYKGIDSVVQALVGTGLVELLARTRPVLTYKTRGGCCE